MHFKIRLLECEKNHIVDKITAYHQIPKQTFLEMYFPKIHTYEFVDEKESADICIIGIQHINNSLLRDNEKNILFCVENLHANRKHYKHYNKFKDFNNNKIDIFIYNHFTKPTETTTYKMYPQINFRMEYFDKIKDNYKMPNIPFQDKKFALFTSQNLLNENKRKVLIDLMQIGKVDFIANYEYLKNKTCYHDIELIKLYSQYKFIICFENSKTPGYITEKIFNVFLSKSIPIYDGAPDIGDFINTRSYITYDNNVTKKINILNKNLDVYNQVVQNNKISKKYKKFDLKIL
jgi:hypothetical protein